jgi:hypothetical protein
MKVNDKLKIKLDCLVRLELQACTSWGYCWLHGGFPVAISITVHATLHISAELINHKLGAISIMGCGYNIKKILWLKTQNICPSLCSLLNDRFEGL